MIPKSRRQHIQISFFLLCGFAFTLPISLGVSEAFLFSALLYAVVAHLRGFSSFDFKSPITIPVAAFICMLVLGIATSTRFSVSVGKIYRLFFFSPLFLVPAIAVNEDKHSLAQSLVKYYVFGTSIYFLYDVVRIAVHVCQGGELFDAGSMTTPQLYMASIFLLAALGRNSIADFLPFRKGQWLYYAMLAMNVVGVVIHFKRGVWLASMICAALLLIVKARWRTLAVIALACVGLTALPQVRERIVRLPEEFASEQGGRWALWTEVAPAIIAEHPWGMGLQVVRHSDLAAHTDYLQNGLNHLHNSLLQVTLELGLLGGVVWLVMMIWILVYLVASYRAALRNSQGNLTTDLMLGATLVFLALFLNGFVEDNFNRSGVTLVYFMVVAITASLNKIRAKSIGLSAHTA